MNTIGRDEERIPGATTEEVVVKRHAILLISADKEVFVTRMTTVNVNSNSSFSSSFCMHTPHIDDTSRSTGVKPASGP